MSAVTVLQAGIVVRSEDNWGLLESESRTYFFKTDTKLEVGAQLEFWPVRMMNTYVTGRALIVQAQET